MKSLEAWGGAECTVNRVGDRFSDQLVATGHCGRIEDFDLLVGLGLDALRLPVLWERVSPGRPEERDFGWSDPRLARLRRSGIRPIVGLIHHGSGPRHTSLLDAGFAPGLAAHALATARRYPWVEEWNPVNEPLTTARFSALYGHWYPHARDERLFWTALLNQVDAIRLSMKAIRSVNPAARLIQTDDLGRTYATAALADQAAFDNTRRWAAWDLLVGRVRPDHSLWHRLSGYGLGERLRLIADDPCPPDIIGINHYPTSDRFLDHRLARYPDESHGGNGRMPYADVAAVRVIDPPPAGLAGAIRECWERYELPIALAEVHNGCTREEQLRWLSEAWQAAHAARAQGVDLCAVTAWALFGNRGWNTLLTQDGTAEPGVFDTRGPQPRATALTRLVAGGGTGAAHPVLGGAGWWRRTLRLEHRPVARPAAWQEHRSPPTADARPLLILGASGTLGRAMAAACVRRGLAFVLTGRAELDLRDPVSIDRALETHRPWAVVNAAGWVRVDDAEAEPGACSAVNRDGPLALGHACSRRGMATLNFSSDLVFDGAKSEPYRESDSIAPLCAYGASKAAMEEGLAGIGGDHLVIRTAAFFSPHDEANFAVHLAAALSAGRRFVAAEDHLVSPTYVPHLCDAALDLLIDGESGIWHLSNGEEISWADFARRIARSLEFGEGLVEPRPGSALGWRAGRPRRCGLASEKGALMPPLDAALRDFAQVYRAMHQVLATDGGIRR